MYSFAINLPSNCLRHDGNLHHHSTGGDAVNVLVLAWDGVSDIVTAYSMALVKGVLWEDVVSGEENETVVYFRLKSIQLSNKDLHCPSRSKLAIHNGLSPSKHFSKLRR
jgi:hypothetical protein